MIFVLLQHWRKLVIQEGGPCPVKRDSHTAVCLGYGGDNPQLLVIGGNRGAVYAPLSDAWMLDVNSRRWKEVRVSFYLKAVNILWVLILGILFGA